MSTTFFPAPIDRLQGLITHPSGERSDDEIGISDDPANSIRHRQVGPQESNAGFHWKQLSAIRITVDHGHVEGGFCGEVECDGGSDATGA